MIPAIADVAQDPRRDDAGGRIFPVVRERYGPHHRRVAQFAHLVEHEPIPRAKRRPHDARVNSSRRKNGLIGALERCAQADAVVQEQMAVTPGVVSNRIPRLHFTTYHTRICGDRASDDKERRANVLGARKTARISSVYGGFGPSSYVSATTRSFFGPLTSVLPKS